jgi:hypothetical protein
MDAVKRTARLRHGSDSESSSDGEYGEQRGGQQLGVPPTAAVGSQPGLGFGAEDVQTAKLRAEVPSLIRPFRELTVTGGIIDAYMEIGMIAAQCRLQQQPICVPLINFVLLSKDLFIDSR